MSPHAVDASDVSLYMTGYMCRWPQHSLLSQIVWQDGPCLETRCSADPATHIRYDMCWPGGEILEQLTLAPAKPRSPQDYARMFCFLCTASISHVEAKSDPVEGHGGIYFALQTPSHIKHGLSLQGRVKHVGGFSESPKREDQTKILGKLSKPNHGHTAKMLQPPSKIGTDCASS